MPVPDSVPVDISYLLGKFDPAARKDFVAVGKPYSDKSGMMLRKEAFEAFKKMFEAAEKDGIALKIISSTRNFDRQKEIWEGKWTRFARDQPAAKDRALKILEYSAMPGASRHHWGTDVDLNDLNNPSFEKTAVSKKPMPGSPPTPANTVFANPIRQGGPTATKRKNGTGRTCP